MPRRKLKRSGICPAGRGSPGTSTVGEDGVGDPWELAAELYGSGRSLTDIARLMGTSTSQVYRRLRMMGVRLRTPREGQLAKRDGWQSVMRAKRANTRLVSIPSSLFTLSGLDPATALWGLARDRKALVATRDPPSEPVPVRVHPPLCTIPARAVWELGFSPEDRLEGKWVAEPGRILLFLRKGL